MCDWHGWPSPWQRECWPWQVPREQLVGSGRLVSKQIYRQSSTTRPPNREGNDKEAIRVKDNKEGIVGQRRESADRERDRPFPTGCARSRRGQQNRLQGGRGAVSPETTERGRFGAICQIQFEKAAVLIPTGSRRRRSRRNFEAGRGIKMSLKLLQK